MKSTCSQITLYQKDYKGNSSNKILFDLILRLKTIALYQCSSLNLIQVAGTRMIAQGTDGLSRGNLNEGVMGGSDMLSFIPLSKSALDVSPMLDQWIKSWWREKLELLSPEGWFNRGHDLTREGFKNDDGIWFLHYKTREFLWTPPPVVAGVAIEELINARQKCQESAHLFVCPRLMTYEWRLELTKVADIIFEIPPSYSFWDKTNHEPLIIGIVFPFLSVKPWQVRKTPAFLEVERILLKMWKKKNPLTRIFCENFRAGRGNFPPCQNVWCGKCYTVPKDLQFHIALPVNDEGIVWRRKRDECRFLVGRQGNHFISPFQCDRWLVH